MSDSPRTLPLDAIIVRDRHRTDLGDVAGLARSIRESGLLHPVVVWPEGNSYLLIAGERRLAAVRSLGMEEVPVRVVHNLTTAKSRLDAERDENTCRKDMTASEKVALADALVELERPKAAEARREGGDVGRANRGLGTGVPKPQNDSHRTDHAAAKAAGFGSRTTFQSAKAVVDAAAEPDASEEIRQAAADMDAEVISITAAHQKVKAANTEAAKASKAAPAFQSREAIDARRQTMRDMAAGGSHSTQIAAAVGMSEGAVRLACRDEGIELVADKVVGRVRRIDANRVVEETVITAAALAGWEALINVEDLNPERLADWASSLGTSIKSLASLKNALTKELARASA